MLKSNKCKCYRDDAGLHLCDEARALRGDAYWRHVERAFGLQIAPDPPKRAVKLAEGDWQAPCGCKVDVAVVGQEKITKYITHPRLLDYQDRDHLAQAVAAVMREQQRPPSPSQDDIDQFYDRWAFSDNIKNRGSIREFVHETVVWALGWKTT